MWDETTLDDGAHEAYEAYLEARQTEALTEALAQRAAEARWQDEDMGGTEEYPW